MHSEVKEISQLCEGHCKNELLWLNGVISFRNYFRFCTETNKMKYARYKILNVLFLDL